jgi:hypothetical protein
VPHHRKPGRLTTVILALVAGTIASTLPRMVPGQARDDGRGARLYSAIPIISAIRGVAFSPEPVSTSTVV